MEDQLHFEWDALYQLGPETVAGSTQFRATFNRLRNRHQRMPKSKKFPVLRALSARSLPLPSLPASAEHNQENPSEHVGMHDLKQQKIDRPVNLQNYYLNSPAPWAIVGT
jgi:hypothetical protein